jgi:hypothetical protein
VPADIVEQIAQGDVIGRAHEKQRVRRKTENDAIPVLEFEQRHLQRPELGRFAQLPGRHGDRGDPSRQRFGVIVARTICLNY